ncbi:NTF2-related export protein 1-like [Watersipora subatra]|uniref:NTF2-related export protein 1-like n=1 Tax=Watersipora subatra TaxID=2589382 RepID=UPI00355B2DED
MSTKVLSSEEHFKFSEASEAATTFSKLFYDTYDKRRQALEKLYLTDATLIWDGNKVNGAANICKYLAELPSSSGTQVECVDCHPIADKLTEGQTSMIVNVMGLIRYSTAKPKSTPFTQTFLMTTQTSAAGTVAWKIVKDSFRTIQ